VVVVFVLVDAAGIGVLVHRVIHRSPASTTVVASAEKAAVTGDAGFGSGARVFAAVRIASGYVAVGSIGWTAAASTTKPPVMMAAWTSPNGSRWTRTGQGELLSDGSLVLLVAGRSGGVVAYGTSERTDLFGDLIDEVWASPDGRIWTRRSADAPADLRAMVAGGPGLVAVGTDWSDVPNGASPAAEAEQDYTVPYVWYSTDGSSWRRAPGGQTVFGRGYAVGIVSAGGRLVAVAVRDDSIVHRGTTTESWISADGIHWQALHLPDATRAVAQTVASDGHHIVVAAGSDDTLAAWTSTDGGGWQFHQPGYGTTPVAITTLARSGGAWYGTGYDHGSGDLLLTSRDGAHWTRADVPALPDSTGLGIVSAALASGTDRIIFITSATNGSIQVASWITRAGGLP